MPTSTPPVIEARGFGWRHASRRHLALEHLTFAIGAGERVLLTGDSGAGKSTLLAALAGVLGGDDEGERFGELHVDGTVGLVLQDPDSQVIASRIGDDVAFGCENLGVPADEIWPRVRRALEMVGLGHLPLNHPTMHLSGGQKQRLALAGIVAMGAQIILLDEPTANLDPEGAEQIVAAMEAVLADTGATFVVVEHRSARWRRLVDRHLHLTSGGIEERALPAELTTPAAPVPPAAAAPRDLSDTPALLRAEDLLTRFGPPRSLALPEGASTVITGRNGTGKTTLLMTLAGLMPPRGGRLLLADSLRQGLDTPPHKWRSAQLAQRIGVVFQDPEHQFVARSVAEELAVGPKVMGIDAGDRIEELLHRLRLAHLAAANPFTLSGGEKRRLSVATALVASPRLLLLDEPTFGQDPETFAELTALLRELADRGITLASITHDPEFIALLGDHRVAVTA